MGYGFAGSISPKAAKKLNGKLSVLRGTKPQKSKMAAFDNKSKDEGTAKGEVPRNEIDHKTNQGGSAAYGRHVSTGGGIGKPESAVKVAVDPTSANKKKWPKGGDVNASNPKTGNVRMKGTIAPQGGQYGGGGRNTQ